MKIRGYLIFLWVFFVLFSFGSISVAKENSIENEIFLPVVKDGKWGFINQNGKMVISPQFDSADPFQEGLAPVRLGDRVGYIDQNGKMAIIPLFDDAFQFKDGFALVRIGKKWGYINKKGDYIWSPTK